MHVPSWSQAQALSALAALGPNARAEIIEALRVNRFPNPKSEGRISHASITTQVKLPSLFPRDARTVHRFDTNVVDYLLSPCPLPTDCPP